jgi:hypothetical protein
LDLDWQPAYEGWQQPFSQSSEGDYFSWPLLEDLMPWTHAGTNFHRKWPIAESREVLEQRWIALLNSNARALDFHETSDRRINQPYPDQLGEAGTLPPIATLSPHTPSPLIVRYGFRSFDRQFCFCDARLGDRYRPPLWRSHSDLQIFITTILGQALGRGPAIVTSAHVTDLNYFNNRGGQVIPLYRDPAALEPNITSGLLKLLTYRYDELVTVDALGAYIVGVMGHSGYAERFHNELDVPGPRVPLTKDIKLFRQAVDLGKQVIAWQTYAERFPETINAIQGRVPNGRAKLKIAIPNDPDRFPLHLREVTYDENKQLLRVGEGVVENVDTRIWTYQVSGMQVVRSWLGYRM